MTTPPQFGQPIVQLAQIPGTSLWFAGQTNGDIIYYDAVAGEWVRYPAGPIGYSLLAQGLGLPAVWAPSGVGTGWTEEGNTWTYAAAAAPEFTLTINADVTGFIQVGDRIRLTQVGIIRYFIVTQIVYGAPNTTLTLYGGTDYVLANAAITSPSYSHVKNPYGFPTDPTRWTVEVQDSIYRTQANPTQNIWYNLGAISISIPTGSWRVSYQVSGGVYDDDTLSEARVTLSTANNSESDITMTAEIYISVQATLTGLNAMVSMMRERTLVLASATTLYLNAMTPLASAQSITFYNSVSTCVIRAICAYL